MFMNESNYRKLNTLFCKTLIDLIFITLVQQINLYLPSNLCIIFVFFPSTRINLANCHYNKEIKVELKVSEKKKK